MPVEDSAVVQRLQELLKGADLAQTTGAWAGRCRRRGAAPGLQQTDACATLQRRSYENS